MEIKEVWLPVKGYENYLVSNMGRVKSLNLYRRTSPGFMALNDHGNGYLYVTLNKGNRSKNFYVHRLVAEAFCLKPYGCDYVDHIDHDRSNNKAYNLEWVTQKENVLRSSHLMRGPRDNGRVTSTGEKHIGYKEGRYRLHCRRWRVDRTFSTLEEAIEMRNRLSEAYDAGRM